MNAIERFCISVTLRIAAVILAGILLSCSNSPNIAGGSTTVENGFIQITAVYEGKPISAEVKLIPSTYDPVGGGSLLSRMSDSAGYVRFDSVPEGSYSVLIQKDSVGVFLTGLSINDSESVTLNKTGTLKIKADPSSSVRLIGSPFVGVYNPKDSTIEFTNIPAGTYPSLKITGPVSVQTDSVSVISNDTAAIDSKEPALSILQVPVWSTIGGSEIRSISVDLLGRLWAAADYSGFFYLNDRQWLRMPNPDTVNSSDGFWTIRVCPASVPGAIGISYLINTGRGPILFEDGASADPNSADPAVPGSAVTAAAVNRWGSFACASDTAVWFHQFGKLWEKRSVSGARSLALGKDTLWVGTASGSVITAALADKNSTVTAAGSTAIDALAQINGRLYAGRRDGLFVLNGSKLELIPGSPDSIRQIVQDSSGVIWAISGSSGIVRLKGSKIEQFSPMKGSLAIREICGMSSGAAAACGKKIYWFR